MDLRPLAAEYLRSYNALKSAIVSIPLEIKALECDMASIRSAGISDGVRSGDVKSFEDKLLNLMLLIRDLELSFARAKSRVEAVDNALSTLLQHEKLVLYRVDIDNGKYAAQSLCEDFECELSAVYRRRHRALDNFTVALFGCVDTDELVRRSEEKLEDTQSTPYIALVQKKKPKKRKKPVIGYDYDADDEEDGLM